MNNKHDVNVRKSTLVHFQVGLIVALFATLLVMDAKSAVKHDDIPIIKIDEPLTESIFNPEYQIEEPEAIVEKQEQVKKIITDEIDVRPDDEVNEFLKEADIVTEPQPTIVNPDDLVEDTINPEPEPISFKLVESVPIFPGCEGLSDNDERRECMSSKINKIVKRKFDTGLAEDLGLSGIQKIYVRFSIAKDGSVTKIMARSPHPRLQKEGERIIQFIPKMIPGKQRLKPVEVIFDLPIIFQVQN